MRYAILALCLAVSPAADQQQDLEIPLQNVDRICSQLSPALAVSQCVRAEQSSYNFVKAVWPSLPPGRRSFCIEKAGNQRGKPFYYMTLASFVQSEATAEQIQRDRVAPPRFRP